MQTPTVNMLNVSHRNRGHAGLTLPLPSINTLTLTSTVGLFGPDRLRLYGRTCIEFGDSADVSNLSVALLLCQTSYSLFPSSSPCWTDNSFHACGICLFIVLVIFFNIQMGKVHFTKADF